MLVEISTLVYSSFIYSSLLELVKTCRATLHELHRAQLKDKMI